MTSSPQTRSGRQPFWGGLPLLKTAYHEWQLLHAERAMPRFHLASLARGTPELPMYPIDMAPLLELPFGHLDEAGVPYNVALGNQPGAYHPTSIAQYGLAQWNVYLETGKAESRKAFLVQARWLLAHEVRLANGSSVWPMPFASVSYSLDSPWLSALTQGNAISVLTRAYRATGEAPFLHASRRAVRSFELDVLDGGVSTPVGTKGIFFEEIASYPATRILNGYVLALFGLLDYVELTGDATIRALAERSLATFHQIIDEYDLGFWTSYDLFHRRVASRFYHALHVVLLEALARATGCEHCAALAGRWNTYQQRLAPRLRYYLMSRGGRYRAALQRAVYTKVLRIPQAHVRHAASARVCVPLTAFPVAGGMRAVVSATAEVTAGDWQMEYLTREIGPGARGLTIRSFEWRLRPFGSETTSPFQFPNVWFYVRSGRRALLRLLRKGQRYDIMLPQDGVFTAAFAAPVARTAGTHVAVMDHGTVCLLYSPAYRAQRLQAISEQPWPKRVVSRARFACYLRLLRRLARRASRHTDVFLVAEDEVEEAYRKHLGVPLGRIVRYPYMIDASLYVPLAPPLRADLRAQLGIAADAIVVTMVSRLAQEKPLEVAVDGIDDAVRQLPADIASRVRIVIAGAGPLRAQLELALRRARLDGVCTLYGEATPADVRRLLGVSDILLYTGTRGINYSMAVLEAMAAGCAVIAWTQPRSNAELLAQGRGIAIPAGDAQAVGSALVQLATDMASARAMGDRAREYVIARHCEAKFKRGLLRAGRWAPDVASLAEESQAHAGAAVGEGSDHQTPGVYT